MMSKEKKRQEIAASLGEAIVMRDNLYARNLIAAACDAETLIKGLKDDLREFEFGRIIIEDVVHVPPVSHETLRIVGGAR